VRQAIRLPAAESDGGAIEFARGFYDGLGVGKDVPFAFNEGLRRLHLKNYLFQYAEEGPVSRTGGSVRIRASHAQTGSWAGGIGQQISTSRLPTNRTESLSTVPRDTRFRQPDAGIA
jgi:hypothetical protein